MNSSSFFNNPYIQAALYRGPVASASSLPSTAMPGVGGSFFGPNHAALTRLLQQSLLQNAGQQGSVANMVQNPQLARSLGGLVGQAYTPPMPQVNRLDYSPNWNGGFLAQTGWGGPISPNVTPATQGSGGFLGGGGL